MNLIVYFIDKNITNTNVADLFYDKYDFLPLFLSLGTNTSDIDKFELSLEIELQEMTVLILKFLNRGCLFINIK
jgi:hypothetical protein